MFLNDKKLKIIIIYRKTAIIKASKYFFTEIKQLKESKQTVVTKQSKPSIDRNRLAELMGISYDGETLMASTKSMAVPLPENAPKDVDPEIINAVTKDYSAMMKKMGLT